MKDFIIYKNSKVAYSDVGKGNAIVLLHGFLENSSMWKEISKELSKNNRVICIDLLGHGDTDCIGYVHTMSDMAEAVKGVLKYLKLRRFYMIGHSMGGYVSLAFAEKYLKNIKGLCLLNSTTQADTEERKELRLRACKMAQTNYGSLVKLSISNLFTSETRDKFALELAQVKKEALKTSVQGYIAASKGMRLRENKEVVLRTINKKIIIAGVDDPVINIADAKIEAEKTNTTIVSLKHGHMSHVESKKTLLETINAFVK